MTPDHRTLVSRRIAYWYSLHGLLSLWFCPVAGSTVTGWRGWADRGRGRRVVQRVTQYAKSGRVSIAYQVVGDGPTDLILVPGFVSHVEVAWEEPRLAHFLGRLASFSRLIVFDKRGTGMSDPVDRPPWMEQRMDDIRAVMDAAGSRRSTLFGISEGGTLSLLFARAHPERTQALILYGSWARRLPDRITRTAPRLSSSRK
jgi:pimeloyl-ACP methyl ester carboxylesterase